jgi:hypothetical protein
MPAINYSDVTITEVYEIDCAACCEAVYPDERILSKAAALKLKQEHIREHANGDWD